MTLTEHRSQARNSMMASNLKQKRHLARMESAQSAIKTVVLTLSAVVALAACSSGSKRPPPAELGANVPLVGVRQAWTNRIGEVPVGAAPAVVGNTVVVASSDGIVASLDAATGRDNWRLALSNSLTTGAGSDGKLAAVVTSDNEVVAVQDGKELWRAKLPAKGFTAPFVAGGRVFVLLADRSVHAFDGAAGRKLWDQRRPGEPLVLRQAGTILAVGDTLVVGLSGRLLGLNPGTGAIRWETPISTSRGTNDIERLNDLVGRVSRVGDVVCARSFQAAVGCVNATRGNLVWTKPANGSEGLHGDSQTVFGTEADGKVLAWRRSDGERLWTTERLQYRNLSAPLIVGRSVVVGDSTGLLHMLSREDGSPLNRLSTDGSAIVGGAVLAGNTLVAVTRNGGVFGFNPE
jgi:outer membrane protein assembly factor BamB